MGSAASLSVSYLVLPKINPSVGRLIFQFQNTLPLLSGALNLNYRNRAFFLNENNSLCPESPEHLDYLFIFCPFLCTFKFCFSLLLELQHHNCYYHHPAENGKLWRDADTESRAFQRIGEAFRVLHSQTALNNFRVLRLTVRNIHALWSHNLHLPSKTS